MERSRRPVYSGTPVLLRKWLDALHNSSGRTRTVTILVAATLSVAQVLGFRMETQGALGISSVAGFALFCLEGFLTWIVFASLLLPLLHFSAGYRGLESTTGVEAFKDHTIRRRLLFVGVLAAAWFLWWIFLWPGVTSRDSYTQIIQALGLVGYSDAHPIAHTMVIQLLLRPALAVTGNMYSAIAFVTLAQLVALAIVVGLSVEALHRLNIPRWVPVSILVTFAAHPLLGWYSVTLWKDVWISAFLLAFATVTLIIAYRRNRELSVGWKLWGMLVLVAIGAMLAKKTGVYIVIPSMVIAVIFLKGLRLRWLFAGLASLVLYAGLHMGLMAAFQVQPGSETEAWSLPVQQIARVVKNDPDGLTTTQRARLDLFFPGEDIGAVYEPWKSNVVKDRLDPQALAEHRSELIALWAELGKAHPAIYLDALAAQTYGYWYPDTYYWMVMALDWTSMVNLDADLLPETQYLHDGVSEDRTSGTPLRELAAAELNGSLRHVPVLGWIFSLGAWTWAAVILAGVAVVRRQWIAAPVVALAGMVWAACMISPVYAEARYALPLLLLVPLLAVAAYMKQAMPLGMTLAAEKSSVEQVLLPDGDVTP